VLWATASAAQLLVTRVQEGTAPEDMLTLYVQRVDFGVPQISYAYRDHDYSTPEVKQFLAPLTAIDEDIQLTDDDRSQLNAIANQSGMLDALAANQSVNTNTLASLVAPTVAYYFDYEDWSKVSLSWANLIDSQQNAKDKEVVLKHLIEAIVIQVTSAGLFQGVVGMLDRQMFDIPSIQGDCSQSPLGLVQLEEFEGHLALNFPKFRSIIARLDDSAERRAQAKRFAQMFESGCFGALSQVFRNASSSFSGEATTMDQYVVTLNRILAAKEPEFIRISVAISNTGRFDSFVRTDAKVAVGPKGSADHLSFTVHSLPNAASDSQAVSPTEQSPGYIQVNTRSTKPVVFYARLSPDLQKQTYGAYQSEQAVLRLGVIASAGANEGPIFSQIAPFSSKAQEEFGRKVDEMKIKL